MTSRLLLRGGCVLTMGAKASNLTEGDVLIDGDVISEVGRGLRARDAEVVDATDTIVMPGFVDTHRHMWTSLFRNLGGTGNDTATFRDHLGPDDVYAATLIGVLGAIEAGITTVVDWWDLDLPLGDAATAAALRAHADSHARTVFVHASQERRPRGLVSGLDESAGPLTTIAVGSAVDDIDRIAEDRALAREIGMRRFLHASPASERTGVVAALAGRGLLGADVTLVHPTDLDEADIAAIASSDAAVSLAPSSEMATGYGSPPIQELIDGDIRPGLGVDREGVAPGDMFAQMRQTISLQHATVFDRKLAGKGGLPKLMTTRDVVRSATIDGARVAGPAASTGSLEPGRQADIIVLRTDRPNIWPINDPIGAVVWGMDTSNIDRVIVAGRTVLERGALETDVADARRLAARARERVGAAAGLASPVTSGAEP
ncbi:MAG TPA: amidohydrolase family protein [Actinomycetota bacterium]|nr:amidohydrolase family protein [Actinomycetota bacterium]